MSTALPPSPGLPPEPLPEPRAPRASGEARAPVATPAIVPAVAPRPRYRRLVAALKLSAATIGAFGVLLGFLLLSFVRRGDVRSARRMAASEMQMLLEPGERIEREAFVSRRHWYHYFREMHGILATTDRRLLYVGVEPASLLPRREYEPQAFEELAYAWDTLTTLRRERVHFNTTRGAVLRSRGEVQEFAVTGPQLERLTSVASYAEGRRVALARQLERERQARIAAEFEARKPKYHTVQRGEALTTIAALFNVTVEELREWNGLPDNRIRAGQTLMVKPQT